MYFRIFRTTFLLLSLTVFTQAFAQPKTGDILVTQSQPKGTDSLYIDFQIKRTSAASFLLGGYNIVFDIDTSVIDTSSHKIINQGSFGNIANNYYPLFLHHVLPATYQLILARMYPGTTGQVFNNTYQSAGRVGFKIKKCGATLLTLRPLAPTSAMVSWIGENVDLSFSPISSFTGTVHLGLPITVSDTAVCPSKSITVSMTAGYTSYTLLAKSKSGITTVVKTQSVPTFTTVVSDTTTYSIAFSSGSCTDTSKSRRITLLSTPSNSSIQGSTDVCTNQILTYSLPASNPTSTYTWSVGSAGGLSIIPGSSTGDHVNVSFGNGASRVDTVKVVETNAIGCSGTVQKLNVKVTACTFNAAFTVNGADTVVSSCQGTTVTFRDASTITSGKITKWHWDFGPGSSPDTSTLQNPPPITYTISGAASVMLVVTNDKGQTDTALGSPAIKIITTIVDKPQPTCGTSGCNEVNFSWPSVFGATQYKIRYKKNSGGTFTALQNVGLALNYKVTATSPGMGGSLAFSDTQNDTVFFEVTAVAGTCNSTTSSIVFCRPSYCVSGTGCSLPAFSVAPPSPSCIGSYDTVRASTTPKNFLAAYPSVRISWDNGKFDTTHTYRVNVTQSGSQQVRFFIIDTTKTNCYAANTVSIPVTQVLDVKPDLGIQSLQCDRVTFVWKHVPGASYYEIKYSGTCIGTKDWTPAPLNGLAEFYELTGLTDGCKINFQVRAVGGCNMTQSDTLISPPSCTCYIGHIASSSITSCALDTAVFQVSDVQVSNWLVSWTVEGVSTPFTFKDSVFKFVPPQQKHDGIGGDPSPYVISYTIKDADNPSGCNTVGTIFDSTAAATDASWSPLKTVFCVSDALYHFDNREITKDLPRNTFNGDGIIEVDKKFYFDPSIAGLGTHTITYNACGATKSNDLTVVDIPCVSTVVDAGLLAEPNGIYTTCSGVIYLTDGGSASQPPALYRYDGTIKGVPELLMKSTSTAKDEGNSSFVSFGTPAGIVVDETTNNDIYFVDNTNFKIKQLVLDKQKVINLAGSINGDIPISSAPVQPVSKALFLSPWGLAIHPRSDTLYVADEGNGKIKSISLKAQTIKLLAGGGSNPIPSLGKQTQIADAYNVAVDSLGVYFSDFNQNLKIQRYSFSTDSVTYATQVNGNLNNYGYKDGLPGTYLNKQISGVTPIIGDYIYFTDQNNYAFRKVNIHTSEVTTVAGSFPPAVSNKPIGQSGDPKLTRFSSPGPVSFNIKGYIDILDGNPKPSVRRYYLPRWGVGTWDNFDSTYIVNCDTDTLTPNYPGGYLRVIIGNKNAIVNGKIFAPKDTGTFTLGYTFKIGRCDTTFLKKVKVVPPPKSDLRGDSTCLKFATLTAKLKKDTTLRYKWYGPDSKGVVFAANDTARSIQVTTSGKYWVDIIYGKNKCTLRDSAHILLSPPSQAQIVPPSSIPNGIVSTDSTLLCFGTSVSLTMKEKISTQPKFKKFYWNTGETTATVTAYGSANYVATAIDSLGCVIKAKYRVVQQPLPNVCIKVRDDITGKNLYTPTYTVSTLAGSGAAGGSDGVGKAATFNKPWGLFLKKDTLWVTDYSGHVIRTVNIKTGVVKTVLGTYNNFSIQDSTTGANAKLKNPTGVVVDKRGNIYVSNFGDNRIFKYDKQQNLYFAFAGSGVSDFADGVGSAAAFSQPYELRMDPTGTLYVADYNNYNIRSIGQDRTVSTYAGAPGLGFGTQDGKGTNARFNWPWGLAFDPSGHMVVAEDANHTLRKINLDTNVTLVGGQFTKVGFIDSTFNVPIAGKSALLNRPWNLVSDNAGNFYFTDAGNGAIRRLDVNGNITTLAGEHQIMTYKDGRYDSASFNRPTGIVWDSATGDLLIADQYNNTIRRMTKSKVTYVCKGSTYRVTDTCNSNTNVIWRKRTASGLSGPLSSATLQIGFKDTATYIATISSSIAGISCQTVVDSVVIKWYKSTQQVSLTVLSPATGIGCQGDTISLRASPAGYSKYYWFTKDAGADLFFDTTNVNSIKYVSPRQNDLVIPFFGVTALNSTTGCLDSSSNNPGVVLAVRPIASFVDTFTCFGSTTQFTPKYTEDATTSTPYSFQWDFGDSSTLADQSTDVTPQYVFPKPGTYPVFMSVRSVFSAALVCSDSVTVKVVIAPAPVSSISVNGAVMDTLKLCGTNSIVLNLRDSVTSLNGPPYTYQWTELPPQSGSMDLSTSITTTARPKLSPGQSTALFGYSVYASDKGSCIGPPDTVFALLSVSPKFRLDASDTSICRGYPLTITPFDSLFPTFLSTDYRYVWDSLGTQVNADTNDAVLSKNPLNSVVYTLNVKNKTTSCTSTYPISISVSDFRLGLPTVPVPKSCMPADSIPLVASALGTVIPPLSVTWIDTTTKSAPTTLYNPHKLSVMVWRDTLHTYLLKIKDASGCQDTAFITVPASIRGVPTLQVVQGRDTGVCVNGAVQIKLGVMKYTPPLDFTWTDAATNTVATEVTNPDSLDPFIAATGSTSPKKYYVVVKDSNNCGSSNKDSVLLTSYDMRLVLTTDQSPVQCRTSANPNPSVNLTVTPKDTPSTTSNYLYTWSNSSTGQIVGSSSLLPNVTISGEYVAQVTNTFTSCVKKDSVYVGILNAPTSVKPNLNNTSISCNNVPLPLWTTYDPPTSIKSDSLVFTWSVDGGDVFNFSSDSAVVYKPLPSDTGFIGFKVVVRNRCGADSNTTGKIQFLEGARAILEVDPIQSYINKDVLFINRSTNSDSLNYLVLGDGSSMAFGYGQNETTTHAYSTEGNYVVLLFANKKNGCNAVDTVIINVSNKRDLFIPTVFSPAANHDDNRFLRVYGINISSQEFSLTIYNRWGLQVYSTDNLAQAMNVGWDGREAGGDAQMGVYTYIVKGKYNDGITFQQTGTITLLR